MQTGDSTHAPGRRWRRDIAVELLALVAMAAIILHQALGPPVIGLADQGDWGRIGITLQLVPCTSPSCTGYVVTRFQMVDPPPWSPRLQLQSTDRRFLTSEQIPVRVAQLVGRVLLPPDSFDLQILGVIQAVMFLAAAWALMAAVRPLGQAAHLAITAIVAFAGTDVGYVQYFNSLFSEPASLIGLLLMLGAALWWALAATASRWHALAYFAASSLLVAAKPQNSPLALPLVVFGAWMGFRSALASVRAVTVAAAIVTTLIALVFSVAQPEGMQRYNVYNTVFADLLAHSPTPQADLQELHLDSNLAAYIGTHGQDPMDANVWDPVFFSKVSYADLARFYLRHPERILDLAQRGARHAFYLRVELGNFVLGSPYPPGARSTAFTHWSDISDLAMPKTLWFISALLALGYASSIHLWLKARGPRDRSLGAVLALLPTLAGIEFAVVLISGEVDMSKKLFLFTALADASLIASFVWAASLARQLGSLVRPTAAGAAPRAATEPR